MPGSCSGRRSQRDGHLQRVAGGLPLAAGWLRPCRGPKSRLSYRPWVDLAHFDCVDSADDHFVARGIA
jgi:hypothetical protein